MTNLTQIAATMGYRNHSPVSKRLNRIREQPKPSDIAEILDEQAAALVTGEKTGWLAPVHSERPELRDRYDKLVVDRGAGWR